MRCLVLLIAIGCNRGEPTPTPGSASSGSGSSQGTVELQCKRFVAANKLGPASVAPCIERAKDLAYADLETCVRQAEHARGYTERIRTRAGLPAPAPEKVLADLDVCAASATDPTFGCVAGAKTDADAEKCVQELYPMLLRMASASSERPEVVRELERMGELLTALHARGGSFPRGTSPRTPAKSCCDSPTRLCATVDDEWQLHWKTIGYKPAGPDLLYQYTYRSDGKTVTIEGLGDMDCDGTTVTYTLDVKVVDGAVQTAITKPPIGQD